jgi:parvulin-like peptidyl-prolyl isomerase
MRKLLKEPLAHFLVLGGLLFIIYGWMNPAAQDSSRTIRITAAEIAWLTETWSGQWRRQPTEEELRGLVSDYVRERLLAREAIELGLDDNDTIVRRRLAQKMDFIVSDLSRLSEPTNEELRAFFKAHPDRFKTVSKISFNQIFFSSERRTSAEEDAKKSLQTLFRNAALTESLGDPSILGAQYTDMDLEGVSAVFGEDFARALAGLALGEWAGPIKSAYGYHLVNISERADERPLDFSEAKEDVRVLIREERRRVSSETYFKKLFEKYEVVVDESVRPYLAAFSEKTR